MAKCNHNCFECHYSDCENDEITPLEILQSEQRDARLTKKEERDAAWRNENLSLNEKAQLRYALDAGYRERRKASAKRARRKKQKVWVMKPVKWEEKYGLDYIKAQRERRRENHL